MELPFARTGSNRRHGGGASLKETTRDDSFLASLSHAACGMVLRDDAGSVIFTTCRELSTSGSALEVELEACREGWALARQRTQLHIVVEMDCTEAIAAINAFTVNRSRYMALVREIQTIACDEREILVTSVVVHQVRLLMTFAAYGRSAPHMVVWLGSGTNDIINLFMSNIPT